MASIETRFSPKQKANLDHARKMLGFKSQAQVLFWFADNAVDIVRERVPPSAATGLWYIEQGKPAESTKE